MPNGSGLTAEQKKEFIDADEPVEAARRSPRAILARTGDEYVTDPPKLTPKP